MDNEHSYFLKLLWYSEVPLLRMGRLYFEGCSSYSNVGSVSFEIPCYF